MLYDYYGELLNEKQRGIYEDTVANDMSLSEIGDEEGISRQAVSEIMQRCDEKLEQYEKSLGLIAKADSIRRHLEAINELADKADSCCSAEIRKLTDEIIKEL